MATTGDLIASEMTAGTRLPPLVCVAGAPRCGTTSLSRLLGAHPDVLFSSVKEPHFFSRFDLHDLSDDELLEAVTDSYLERYFSGWREAQVLAEGSVSYLYAPDHMRQLRRLWPDAKFIVTLRDP